MHDATKGAHGADVAGSGTAPQPDLPPLGTVSLSPDHDVGAFDCSRSARVQSFLRDEAPKYVGLRYCNVFIWPHPDDPSRVWGFYTLSSCNIQRPELINKHERKVPKGLPVPVALIGYMGKADGAPKGFGGVLIADAALRVSRSSDIAAWGLALEPENEQLAKWYADQGFVAAKNKPRFMYGPLSAFSA